MADVISTVSDAVRYTCCLSAENYVGGSATMRRQLEAAGYQMIYGRNHWLNDPEYKGINTRWQDPDGGRFELQFHTRESFYAKEQLTHRSYERLRAPDISWEELSELKAYQRAVGTAIPWPIGIGQIPDRWEDAR